MQKGFSDAQAKLKAVWQNPQIASICSQMPNMTILMANVAAALDKTQLSVRDNELMQLYAQETRSAYCAGCTDICESCVDREAPIGDVMRYLMYANSYDDEALAAAEFKKIAPGVQNRSGHQQVRPGHQQKGCRHHGRNDADQTILDLIQRC